MRLAHRGPDGQHVLVNGPVLLGHARLSIIDLSARSDQPMRSASGLVSIVFNGEIYNYRELRQELEGEGTIFRTTGDTEVLLEGYERHGTAYFEKLRGMWAFAIHDARNHTIVLARDPFGIKPLVYAIRGGSLYFSSEIRALREIFPLDPDPSAYPAFFNLGYFIAPATPYKNVQKLRAGEVLEWNLRTKTFELKGRVSRFLDEPDLPHSRRAAVDYLDRALTESVEAHYVADLPVSMLLSGGTDSSLIAALSKKLGRNPTAYHIAVPQSEDTAYAEAVAKHLGLHLIIKPLSQSALEKQYEKVWNIIDEPTADISIIPTSLVFEHIKGHSKVVLSGDGGDELFSGYLRHRPIALHQAVAPLHRTQAMLNMLLLPTGLGLKVWNPLIERIRVRLIARGVIDDLVGAYLMIVRLVRYPIREREVRELLSKLYEAENDPRMLPMLAFDLLSYLPNDILQKTDTASMASSIEARVPFVDRRVMAASVATLNVFGAPAGEKLILKEVLARYLPRELVFRNKSGFGVPMHAYDPHIFIADFQKACGFHLENQDVFGVDAPMVHLIENKDSREIIARKYPRFAFALISNWKVHAK